jgi:hypothetical protein
MDWMPMRIGLAWACATNGVASVPATPPSSARRRMDIPHLLVIRLVPVFRYIRQMRK